MGCCVVLDQGISLRLVLATAVWVGSVLAGVGAVTLHSVILGQLGLLFAALGCTLVILCDNAKTRRVVRAAVGAMTEPREPGRPTSIAPSR